MLKKKLLFSLVIVQGILILAGIIAIVLGIFYKFNKSASSLDKINQNIDFPYAAGVNEPENGQPISQGGPKKES